jgi:DNA processing protein
LPAEIALETAVALAEVRPPGDTRIARAFWEALRRWPPAEGLSEPARVDAMLDAAAALLEAPPEMLRRMVDAARPRARASIGRARQRGLTPVAWYDHAYPARLAAIPDPPVLLWTRGMVSALAEPAVAIVGSRRATPAGLATARRLAGDLAGAGLTIVSGLARGVDGAAHAGALAAGGVSIGVLGCGADRVYPAEHTALAAELVARGAIVSELSPGTPPLPPHFPLRNRLISGLVLAVVIVEASDKSGSLITARLALEQGRDVLAVPGSVLSGQYRGSHALIKDGARLVETVGDVLDEIGWVEAPKPGGARLHLSGIEHKMAPAEPYTLDDLAVRTGRPARDLLAELGALEIQGRIERDAGGRFVRLDGRASDREEHGQGTRRRRIAVESEDDQQISGA